MPASERRYEDWALGQVDSGIDADLQVTGSIMELSEEQTDSASLVALAADVARLLCDGHFDDLATIYGYALAFGRPLSVAIEADLTESFAELGATSLLKSNPPPAISVKYFSPIDHFLFAVAECVIATNGSGSLLLDLVVAEKDERKYLCIEQISVWPDSSF